MPSDNDTTRRRLLKSIGATGLAVSATGFASATSASDEPTELEARYRSLDVAQQAVADHAAPVLAELADRGVLERGDATELEFGGVESRMADGATVKGLRKGDATTVHVETTTELDDGHVEIAVRPSTGRAYATVRPDDGDAYTIESEAGSDDVSTTSCWYEHKCASYMCGIGSYCQYLERECCANSCTDWYDDGCCSC
jgi:hypothetical protein